MIDMEKSILEAEAIAKLQKEQYFREVLAGELGVMIDQHFASKEPLREVLPKFVGAIKDLAVTARQIFDYIEGVEPKEAETEKTPAEVLEIINKKPLFSDLVESGFVEDMKKITKPKAAEESPSTAEDDPTKLVPPPMAAEKVSNEKIEELLRGGFTHAQIAKRVGMTANAVSHRIAYIKDKKDREQGIEKPAPKPRAFTRDIISDAELEEQYFKRGLTIKEIAEKLGINPSSLYKRVEAMRDKRFEIAKECVSSQ